MLQNKSIFLSSVTNLVTTELEYISIADWISKCDHIMKTENDYVRSDQTIHNVLDDINCNTG